MRNANPSSANTLHLELLSNSRTEYLNYDFQCNQHMSPRPTLMITRLWTGMVKIKAAPLAVACRHLPPLALSPPHSVQPRFCVNAELRPPTHPEINQHAMDIV